MFKKSVQKLYKLYTKTIKNTKFVYIFCIQNLCKWWMYKNVQTVENLFKVQTKNGFKLEMYVFCTYTQCTNYTKCIQMLIESCMWLLMYAFCIYKNPTPSHLSCKKFDHKFTQAPFGRYLSYKKVFLTPFSYPPVSHLVIFSPTIFPCKSVANTSANIKNRELWNYS